MRLLFYVMYNLEARGNVVDWRTILQAGRSRVLFPARPLYFSVDLILPVSLWPWGRLNLWQNVYQESSCGWKAAGAQGWKPHGRLWADCLENMWEPRRLATLWASTLLYRDSYTFHVSYIVTDFLKSLLSNGPINTQRPNRSNNRRKTVFSMRSAPRQFLCKNSVNNFHQ
jgi:hypothetical protein